MKRWSLLFVMIFGVQSMIGQDQVSVMCYNLLNFPEGFMPDRQDSLRKIIDYVQPDLFLMQELRSGFGLELILEESFANLPGNFEASEYVPNQSNQNSDFNLQQAIIFNSDKFGMVEQRLKTTDTRDINIFKMYFKDVTLEQTMDTTYLYVFNTHLKSSQGESNEALRLEAAETFTLELGNLDPNSMVLFGGDFNVYNSNEPAYQELISDFNAIQMRDPIDAPGNWSSSSYPFKQILTQSTRVSQIYNDGAGGGLDDRFDFVLASQNLLDGSTNVQIDPQSYLALGNNGECYNQNITQCDENNDVPTSMLRTLYYMSDHLPVVFNMDLDFELSINSVAKTDPVRVWQSGDQLNWSGIANEEIESISFFNSLGQFIGTHNANDRYIGHYPTGLYIVSLKTTDGYVNTRLFKN